jgi:predicted kinase
MQRSHQMVFVSGAPGAGKTSLAVPLAAELGFALVCKDKLKETLHDAPGAPAPDLAWSRKLGAAAMELLWALAADAPSVVIEANFRPRDPYQRRKLSALAEQPVEVWCRCDPELAARRTTTAPGHATPFMFRPASRRTCAQNTSSPSESGNWSQSIQLSRSTS